MSKKNKRNKLGQFTNERYWTDDKVIEESLKYEYLRDFRTKSGTAYAVALKYNLFEDKITHLKEYVAPRKFWTDEKIIEESLKYKTRKDFRKYSNSAYQASKKYGLLGTVITHLGKNNKRRVNGSMTFDKLMSIAKRYKTRKSFCEDHSDLMSWAKGNGYWNEITEHMDYVGDQYKRGVYVFEFSDNSCYVGLTGDFDRRLHEHISGFGKTSVFKHISENNVTYNFKIMSDYITSKNSQKLEGKLIKKYKKEGWNILNSAKAGGLGYGEKKWTREKVIEESKKYNRSIDFKKGSYSAYVCAQRHGWLNECTKNFNNLEKWSKEKIFKIASTYKTYSDFIKNEIKAKAAMHSRGLHLEVKKLFQK